MMMYQDLLYIHASVIVGILTQLHAMELPEITSYARVSKTGTNNLDSSIISTKIWNNSEASQGRSFHVSPVYMPSVNKLRKGEAMDFPSIQSYSTLDQQMLAKLDGRKSMKQAQDRFHPPAPFEHSIAHANKMKDASESDSPPDTPNFPDSPRPSASMSSDTYSTLPKNIYPDVYDYQPSSKPKDYLPSITTDDYSPDNYDSKPKLPSYLEKYPEFDHSTFNDFPDSHDHYDHELIYDHPPDHYHHDYTTMTTTTEEPEMNDQRLNKRPYSYYFIGKKLWYLPLYFSIYFIIYIAALVLKSIARHKINFPANLAEAAGARHMRDHDDISWWNLTKRVLDGIDRFASENNVKNNS